MGDKYATLATQCTEFCRHLDAQGRYFKFSISIGSDFTFSLDTEEEATTIKEVRKKKLSPSSLRRNERRKLEFLNKKSTSSETKESSEKKTETSEKKAEASEKKAETSEKRAETSEKKSELSGMKPEDKSEAPEGSEAVKANVKEKETAPQPWRRTSRPSKAGKVQVPSPDYLAGTAIIKACGECMNSRLPCAKHKHL